MSATPVLNPILGLHYNTSNAKIPQVFKTTSVFRDCLAMIEKLVCSIQHICGSSDKSTESAEMGEFLKRQRVT